MKCAYGGPNPLYYLWTYHVMGEFALLLMWTCYRQLLPRTICVRIPLSLHDATLGAGIATRRGMPRADRELCGAAVRRQRRGKGARETLAPSLPASHRVAVPS